MAVLGGEKADKSRWKNKGKRKPEEAEDRAEGKRKSEKLGFK